ncbi:HNH endonuclease signature motif containing protein [Arthrobacter sp. PM3]|uniref:HNH endonuclease signature motif containing protein n=1 Tax=Arthrobacter sp. PM3 TaxID=2017685 RepID=UPI000E1062B1|nr:HNH endonuclease signature motif containing protein [Arthrobacter sp. PM3]AXJ10694.1 endonuclease [Arthrobacter sp. PM3]
MEGRAAWSRESGEALAAVAASVAALAALAGGAASSGADVDSAGAAEPGTDPLRDFADGCLDGLALVARLEAGMAALKVRLAADYVQAAGYLAGPAASPQEATAREMAVLAEVAGVLTVSERSASALLSDALALTGSLPLTLAALQAGELSWQHARIMVDEAANLDRAGAAGLEAHFLDPAAPDPARGCPAGELAPGRFRAKARTWRERHHPDSIEARHATGVAERRVEFVPDRDGMAWLSARLPADTAAGIWERTTAAARALQGPGESRTLAQLRADVTATWLLTTNTGSNGASLGDAAVPAGNTGGDGMTRAGGVGGAGTGTGNAGVAGVGGCGGVPSPRAQVLVTVPVMALLGATEEPAMLDGYGPVPPSMARRLVADGANSFHRVLVDPRDGAPLEIGRTSYRVTKAMRQWLRLRDGRCSFPGCNNPSLDNEADHLLAWADGGTTGVANLAQPCPKHHRLKHNSAWTPGGASGESPPGWTSPAGRHYRSEYPDWEPPRWPEHFVPPDPGPDPDAALPPDPFPEWHQFTMDRFSQVDPHDFDWPPVGDPLTEYVPLQCA